MASPSLAEVQNQWKNAVKLLNEARNFGNVNAQNWVSLQDTLEQSYESDFVGEMAAGVSRSRSFLAGLLSNQNAAAHQLPHLKSYCRHVANTPELGDPQEMADRIYRYMIDNSLTVNAREFTHGSWAAGGGNAGNGTILRLTVDEYNHRIENCHADARTAICKFDQSSGTAKHEEIFEFYGQAPGPDGLQLSGSGQKRNIAALSARNSRVGNPSFSQFGGTISSPTSITSWTSSVTVNSTNYSLDQTNYYRDFQGDATPTSLNVKVTANLTQKLSLFNTKLRPDVPYMLQVAWNRQVGSASGTLLIRMGAVSNSVAVAAQTGWQVLRVVASPGQNNWFRQFNEQDLDIAIEWTRTAGELLIDDVLLVPATQFDGTWNWVIGGSTPFLRNDSFTATDTEVGSILQYWFWRAYGRYLPSATGGTETWTDP
jgi:hypothetical protein